MKRLQSIALGLVLALTSFIIPAFSQCTPSQAAFDAAYLASKPPAVIALKTAANALSQVQAVVNQGAVVDVPIDVWGWDACLIMAQRAAAGYTWVPSALQPNIIVVPNVTYNGQTYDPSNPPPGSIIVTTNAASYTPYLAPKPATPIAGAICTPPGPPANGCTDPVGAYSFGTTYADTPGDTLTGGAVFTDTRGTFTKTIDATPFGNVSFWTLN